MLLLALVSVGVLAGVYFGAPYIVRSIFDFSPETVTDLKEYRSLRSRWPDELVGHFPSRIPKHATDVRMDYYPGFLQGGASFQLRVKLPKDEVAAIQRDVAKTATHAFQGGDTNDHRNLPDGVPTTFYYTSGSDDHTFPVSFMIYVLTSTPRGSEDMPWNHGNSAGMAISGTTGVVVYWCTSW